MRGERTPRQLPDWIADHMQRSLETDAKERHISRGAPTLLLTTTGRRSGYPLMLPLMDALDGDRSVIVASQGRQKYHPGWSPTLLLAPGGMRSAWSPPSLATKLGQVANSVTRAHHWAYTSSVLPA